VRRERLDEPARVLAAALPEDGIDVPEERSAVRDPAPEVVVREPCETEEGLGQPLRQLGDRPRDVVATVVHETFIARLSAVGKTSGSTSDSTRCGSMR
jgi:hypothetical protein